MPRRDARVPRLPSAPAFAGALPLRVVAIMLMALLLSTACSRLTFVRPDAKIKGTDYVAQEVEVSDEGRSDAGKARAHVSLAHARLVEGNIVSAEKEARRAVKLDPKSVDANTMMGAVLERSGKTAQAGDYYRRAIELAPDSGGPLNNYGTWLCSNGQPAESLAWFDRALADPRYASPAIALANAGSCADRAGQGARADRDLRRAIALDPNNPVALATLAEREFRAGNAFEARAFSERRLAAAPADARSLQLASQIEEKLGDRAAAARYVQRLRAEFPSARASGTGEEDKK